MKQEVTRKHKADSWALDDVIYLTQFTDFKDAATVRSGPKEGVFVNGLFAEGATWNRHDGTLAESAPKEMFAVLPVLHVTGTTAEIKSGMIRQGVYGPSGPYESPVYKYPHRTGRFYIFNMDIVSKNDTPRHWILRGVAVLCSTD